MKRNQLGKTNGERILHVGDKIFAYEKETTFETYIRRGEEVLLCIDHHKASHMANTAWQGPVSLGPGLGTR